MWVKVCGCRTAEGVEAAVAAGADAVGVIFAESRRRVTPELAATFRAMVPSSVALVGVVHRPTIGDIRALRAVVGIDMLQVSGRLPAGRLGLPLMRTVYLGAEDRLPPGRLPRGELLHLDRRHGGFLGGSGLGVSRLAARRLAERRAAVLAGGLSPENVAEAISLVRPYGVDVASGVEVGGNQDPGRIFAFVRKAKGAGR